MKGLNEELAPLTSHEAAVEANRCLFCYDAPCTHACPTHIDIPRFIKKIATGNLTGSARTILESNLLGATCARVCPVQELCEGACVLGSEHKPIAIGRLQRHAMDSTTGQPLVKCAPPTGHQVAVVGSGPAGLSCAGELARRGHQVTIFEQRPLAGGLSTYGIISLREPIGASLEEVRMIESLGVRIETGTTVDSLDDLRRQFDAVFLGIGLGKTPALGVPDELTFEGDEWRVKIGSTRLGIPGEDFIIDGLDYIEQSKLNPADMKVGNDVVVIGAGNTAIDCATVAKRLGANRVTMVYRRTEAEMRAYPHELEFVRQEGVQFRFLMTPTRVVVELGKVTGLACRPGPPGKVNMTFPSPTEFVIPADSVIKAIGQEKLPAFGLETEQGYLKVSPDMETSTPGVFAGGDCIRVKNTASTVMAVQDGKLAAAAIHRHLENKHG